VTFVDRPVTVRPPATSANLGPGFDALGLALELRDTVTARVVERGLHFEISGEGADSLARDESHLLYRAMAVTFDALGVDVPGLHIECENVIPHGRGMGSSAAVIAAGIVAARSLVSGGAERMDDRTVLQIASDLEGHPDNVAPALFGGFTIAWSDGAAVDYARLDVDVPCTVFVPEVEVATKAARDLLPGQVPFADAAFNVGRAALMVAALTTFPERLISATEDRLHQSYRSVAMPDSYKLVRSLRVEGIAAVVSGAGPTVLAFANGIGAACPDGWTTREVAVASTGALW
jgi:homoserine kinase